MGKSLVGMSRHIARAALSLGCRATWLVVFFVASQGAFAYQIKVEPSYDWSIIGYPGLLKVDSPDTAFDVYQAFLDSTNQTSHPRISNLSPLNECGNPALSYNWIPSRYYWDYRIDNGIKALSSNAK